MMTQEQKKIGFALIKVITEQFAIIDSSYQEGKSIELKIGLKFGSNTENRNISAIFLTQLIQEGVPFLILEVACHFNIEEFAWNNFLNKDSGVITIPKGFLSHLVMLTIGTARGVLHSKTENTPYNKYLLPTLNVSDLVNNDLILKSHAV
jgi:hypothetical protein